MVRRTSIAIVLLALALHPLAATPASNVQWLPAPPGTAVEKEFVAFNGETSANRWGVILSKKGVGTGNGREFYQWYLSIYALRMGQYRLRYQSPRNGAPLSWVEQAHGAPMWFPVQDARIVAAAQLMKPGVEQLVIASHEMAADCGSATITVFATKPGGSIGPVATVTNPCDLSAKLGADRASILLTGPYYGANAPLCCPTKAHAGATLRYHDGKWTELPSYFALK